jgi:hypothetical protein
VFVSVRRLFVSVIVVAVGALAFMAAPALAAPETPELVVEDTTAVVGSPSSEARLHGVLNPKAPGEEGIYQFLYKASKAGVCAGGSVAPVLPGMSFGFEREEYFETITGLVPGTEYAVCLRVESTKTKVVTTSPAVSFTTPVPPEKPETTSPAVSVTATTATLEGVLNPVKAGEAGTYEFLYRVSATECEGGRVSPEPAGVMSGAVKQVVSVSVSALEPNATYTFCLLARNAAGETALGSAVHFTTPAAPPTILSESVSHHNNKGEPLATGEARLEGAVNPNNQLSECHFQYGEASVSEHEVSCEPELLKGYGEQGVAVTVGGLTGAPYHYRILAKNGKGEEATGSEKTVLPPETPETKPASPVTTSEATLHGVLNPASNHEPEPGTYEFVYRQSPTECQRENKETGLRENENATPSTPATGSKKEPVQALVSELLPGATYTVCLLVRNTAGETAVGSPVTFTTLASAPLIEESSVSDVASSSATLSAKIDPRGSETTYRFEYGTSGAYGSQIPVPDGIVGSGPAGVTVSAHPQDLTPSTEYHYRVLALVASKSETVPGSDGTFTTQPSGSTFTLPDGRQWELVSPPNKHGAGIFGLNTPGVAIQAARDGSGITYVTDNPTELGPPGYTLLEQVLSSRGARGWSSRDIGTLHETPTRLGILPEYQFFSPDLSSALAFPTGPEEKATLLSSEATERTPYVRRESLCDTPSSASECYLPVLTGKERFADVPPGTKFGGYEEVHFEGASPDLSHVLLREVVAGLPQLAEWSANQPPSEALQPVNVLPASEGGGTVLGSFGGNPEGEEWRGNRHSISDDGSHVFWSGENYTVYMRDMLRRETVRLDVQQPGVPSGGHPYAYFQIASSDGSKAFFTDVDQEQRLTPQSGSGGRDLYECEISEVAGKLACKLTDLTPETAGQSAGVQRNVLGASENGSYVYFAASGVLGDGTQRGAVQGSCNGDPNGTCNLYEYHAGKVVFIAALSNEDENDWDPGSNENMSHLTARVSPDGRYVAFMSSGSLTGYDNRDALSGKPDQEVYLYDAVSKRLVCASCNPTGSRPSGVEDDEFFSFGKKPRPNFVDVLSGDGEGAFTGVSWVAANLPSSDWLGGYGASLYQPRALSDGGRVFFNSSDALVPQDVNGQEDVYEFEPVGMGSCTASSVTFSSRSGGCVFLVSSGASPEESAFLDASESGSDVFFLTSAKLAAQDYDASYDIYDAHECSASAPCAAQPVPSPPCSSGDSCKAAPSPQPSIYGAPASATFTGTGNVVPEAGQRKVEAKTAKCGKGRVRRHGECVKAKKKKRKTRGKAKKSGRSGR